MNLVTYINIYYSLIYTYTIHLNTHSVFKCTYIVQAFVLKAVIIETIVIQSILVETQ